MTNHRERTQEIRVSVPRELYAQIAAAAQRHDLPITKLVLIWLESQVSPGADVVIGKAHS